MGHLFLKRKVKSEERKEKIKNFKFLVLFFLSSLLSFSSARSQPSTLPLILQLYSAEPKTLEEVEQLIHYRWFEKALEALQAYPSSGEKVLFLKGSCLMGMKKYSEALAIFEGLQKSAASAEIRAASLLKGARNLSRLKNYPASLQKYDRILNAIKARRRKEKYRWEAFKTALEGKNYSRGLAYLKDMSGPKVFWWRGWCWYRLKNHVRALNNWKLISEKRNSKFHAQALYWEARIYRELGEKKKAVSHEALLLKKYPTNYYGYLSGATPAFYPELYPRPFLNLIEGAAKKRRVDSLLIFSLIRQESHFQESAVSRAGALGVMQIMPQTALMLAKVSKYRHFDLLHLFHPQVNIDLGCFYIQFLGKLFSGRAPLILAAYNAGEEAVSRWLALRNGEPLEIFIEEIPFEETQNYTKKVLTNYWMYHWLYRNAPPPKIF